MYYGISEAGWEELRKYGLGPKITREGYTLKANTYAVEIWLAEHRDTWRDELASAKECESNAPCGDIHDEEPA